MAGRITDIRDYRPFFQTGQQFHFVQWLIISRGPDIMVAAGDGLAASSAFTLEVYLKVLAHLESGRGHRGTHNIKELFEDLSPHLQGMLEADWSEKNLEHAKAALADSPWNDRPPNFRTILELSATAFYDFRYNSGMDLAWGLMGLETLVRRQILHRRPDWKPKAGSAYSLLDPHSDFVEPEPYNRDLAFCVTKLGPEAITFNIFVRRATDPTFYATDHAFTFRQIIASCLIAA